MKYVKYHFNWNESLRPCFELLFTIKIVNLIASYCVLKEKIPENMAGNFWNGCNNNISAFLGNHFCKRPIGNTQNVDDKQYICKTSHAWQVIQAWRFHSASCRRAQRGGRSPSQASGNDTIELSPWRFNKVETSRSDSVTPHTEGWLHSIDRPLKISPSYMFCKIVSPILQLI